MPDTAGRPRARLEHDVCPSAATQRVPRAVRGSSRAGGERSRADDIDGHGVIEHRIFDSQRRVGHGGSHTQVLQPPTDVVKVCLRFATEMESCEVAVGAVGDSEESGSFRGAEVSAAGQAAASPELDQFIWFGYREGDVEESVDHREPPAVAVWVSVVMVSFWFGQLLVVIGRGSA